MPRQPSPLALRRALPTTHPAPTQVTKVRTLQGRTQAWEGTGQESAGEVESCGDGWVPAPAQGRGRGLSPWRGLEPLAPGPDWLLPGPAPAPVPPTPWPRPFRPLSYLAT